ncbi:four-carbon acid sugar kinase family protein [Streptomyces sp. NPDC015414]|uniref:four-carbon acid sugar kinase family protein n=1 Tax=Streptomyces sp. NPDC015414 TaxID=3364957 RepID=UPI0036F90884
MTLEHLTLPTPAGGGRTPARFLTVVLDDDPTGTQCTHGVDVVLDAEPGHVAQALRTAGDSLYVLTNTRSLPESAARDLVTRLAGQVRAAAAWQGRTARVVLRGDSTLRGHAAAEMEAAGLQESVGVLVPAYPAAGRTTVGGVHRLLQDGRPVEVARTEYAADPVFGYCHSDLARWAKDAGLAGPFFTVPLAELRDTRAAVLLRTLLDAPLGSVVIPDAETDDDIRLIAAAMDAAERQGRPLLARTASPLAAQLAGTVPQSLHGDALARHQQVLVVCGSHTEGATRQLAALGGRIVELPTDLAFEAAGRPELLAGLVTLTRRRLESDGFAILATERTRRTQHARLQDGAVVMDALVAVTRRLIAHCDALVAKGGITSADLARRAAGAATAHVLGQVETGVPVWRLHTPDHSRLTYVVVPGNIGSPDTLRRIVRSLRTSPASRPTAQGDARACPMD